MGIRGNSKKCMPPARSPSIAFCPCGHSSPETVFAASRHPLPAFRARLHPRATASQRARTADRGETPAEFPRPATSFRLASRRRLTPCRATCRRRSEHRRRALSNASHELLCLILRISPSGTLYSRVQCIDAVLIFPRHSAMLRWSPNSD